MKIAIIGAPDSVEKIYNILSKTYEDTEFIPRATEKIEDMEKLVFDIKDSVNGIYLGGIGIYSSLKDKTEIKKPLIFSKRGGIGVMKSFWEFRNDNHELCDLEHIKLGLDIIDEKDFIQIMHEFDIKIDSYYLQKYDSQKTETDYINNYLEKIKNNEINCIFTCFGYIYYYFKEKNFPVYRIQAADWEIKEDFKTLQNMIKITEAEKSKISVEIIKIMKSEDLSSSILEDKMQFEQELLAYSREVEGNIQISGDNEYLILSNKGLLGNKENLQTIFSMIDNRKNKGFSIGVGIGEGDTIVQAEKNARVALKLSLNEKKNNIYFSNGKEIKGPLLSTREIIYKSSFDKKNTEISKSIGVSSLYIEKIKSIIRKQEKNTFTSREIAEFLNISERSVNRIIKKLIENNLAVEAEFESSAGAGRPRRKTRFIF